MHLKEAYLKAAEDDGSDLGGGLLGDVDFGEQGKDPTVVENDTIGEGEDPNAAPPAAAEPQGRPDWLREDKFWDGDKGVNNELLYKNYRELVTKQSQGKLGNVPEDYTGYELALPEAFPEGVIDPEAFDEDPMVVSYKQKAHELGLPDKAVSELWDWYMERAMENQPEPFDRAAELEALGPTGGAIMEHLSRSAQQWRRIGLLNDEDVEVVRSSVFDAAGATTWSKIINHLQGNAQIPTRVPQEGLMSMQQLDAKLHETYEDGPYKGQRKYMVDPVFRAEVDEDYEKVHGNNPAGSSIPIEVLLQQQQDR